MSRIYINDGWKFAENFNENHILGVMGEEFKEIRIPHTTKELPFNYFSEEEYQMLCTYSKVISAPSYWSNMRVFITFDGAAHYAEVYLNGEKIGEHFSGYTAFSIELSKYLRFGQDNLLVVKLDSRESLNIPPFGNVIDYMTFGGIYRDVYIDIKEKTFISDVFVKPEATGKIVSDITIDGHIYEGMSIRQTATINGERTLITEKPINVNNFSINGFVENVKVWGIESPTLYEIETQLCVGGKVFDSFKVLAGFRNMEFKNEGFFLNGKRVQITGLNRHQSYPYVGYAMPESMQRDDARVLKSLGVNAVRTSHYPQSQYFIDECDKLGLLVFTEIPGWQYIGNEEWKEQAVKNVEEMILQYRNHPSIILWGVRINESPDDHDLYVRTNALAHKLDPTRQTGGVRCIKKSELLEDVYTYNEFRHDGKEPGCFAKEEVTSDVNKPYLTTENNGHMFPTKSFDCEEHRLEHALRHAKVLNDIASHPDISGSFSWCFFDYNTHKDFGSGDRICYHGICDMFRNEKFAAVVYKSQGNFDNVLDVSSSMDIGEHPACIKGNVWIFSNADSVKMYKNDKFIKEYFPDNEHYPALTKSPMLVDDYVGDLLETEEHIPHKTAVFLAKALNYIGQHGYTHITPKLAAMAFKCVVIHKVKINRVIELYTKHVGDWGGRSTVYRFDAIKNGMVVKTVIKTPMNKMHLEINAPTTTLCERTSYDVGVIRIRALDEHGNVLPLCNEPIKINIDGPIAVIGPDILSLRGGMGAFYVKTLGKKGSAKVTISCPNLEDRIIDFEIL